MKNINKVKQVAVGILAAICIAIIIVMVYKLWFAFIPQLLFIGWRCWYNYQTYIRGIFYNKRISWSRVGGVVFAILVFEATLTAILFWGGFY